MARCIHALKQREATALRKRKEVVSQLEAEQRISKWNRELAKLQSGHGSLLSALLEQATVSLAYTPWF